MIGLDTSEVMRLSADLRTVGPRVALNARKAVEVTARRVKDDARDKTRGMYRLGRIPASISYDMHNDLSGPSAEIGFDKSGQGNLGNIIEYGSRHFPARGPLTGALHDNADDFVRGLERAVDDSMRL